MNGQSGLKQSSPVFGIISVAMLIGAVAVRIILAAAPSGDAGFGYVSGAVLIGVGSTFIGGVLGLVALLRRERYLVIGLAGILLNATAAYFILHKFAGSINMHAALLRFLCGAVIQGGIIWVATKIKRLDCTIREAVITAIICGALLLIPKIGFLFAAIVFYELLTRWFRVAVPAAVVMSFLTCMLQFLVDPGLLGWMAALSQ